MLTLALLLFWSPAARAAGWDADAVVSRAASDCRTATLRVRAVVALVGAVMLIHGLFALMGRRGPRDRTTITEDAHLTQTLRRASQAISKHK